MKSLSINHAVPVRFERLKCEKSLHVNVFIKTYLRPRLICLVECSSYFVFDSKSFGVKPVLNPALKSFIKTYSFPRSRGKTYLNPFSAKIHLIGWETSVA